MNRHKKELLKNFTAEEIQQMEEFDSKVRELHALIFPEEYDYMWDSFAESKDRNKGVLTKGKNKNEIDFYNHINLQCIEKRKKIHRK